MAEPGALRIGMVMLGVRDMARSLGFYRDVLRLPVQFSSGEFSFLSAGAVNLVLRHAGDLPAVADDRQSEIVFQVEDVDAMRVAPGLAVTITTLGGAHELGHGTIDRVSPRLDRPVLGQRFRQLGEQAGPHSVAEQPLPMLRRRRHQVGDTEDDDGSAPQPRPYHRWQGYSLMPG